MKQKRHLHSEQLLPSHVIWWLVTNWKRRLNILNEVNQHFITQGLLYTFQKIPHLSDPAY